MSHRVSFIDDPTKIDITTITLDQLSLVKEFSKVNVNAKVIDISPSQIEDGEKTKQKLF